MSNESVNQDEKKNVAVESEKNPTDNQVDKQNQIPQARFNDYVAKTNTKLEEMTTQLESYKKQEESLRVKKLEEEGNYKQLISEKDSELEKLREFQQNISTQMAEKKDRLIKQLPEDQRPIYNHLPVDALEQHLNLNNGTKVQTNTTQPKRVGNQEFGGYKDTTEWAIKDPKSFTEHLEKNVEVYIK